MTLSMIMLSPCPLKIQVRTAIQKQDSAEYEVFCQWTPSHGAPIEWSRWKTYEDFQQFDDRMRRSKDSVYSKMMVTVAFAPPHRVHAFFHQDQTSRFLEKRRKELDYYMQRILLFSGVSDFTSGTGSRVLAEFIDASQSISCRAFAEQEKMEKNDDVRSRWKQTMADAIVERAGEKELKRFKRKLRDFRKENDVVHAATDVVLYIQATFDAEFAHWLLSCLPQTLKSDDQKNAIAFASRRTEKDILKHVEVMADGDRDKVTTFKRAAKALGALELSADAFACLLAQTFGQKAAVELLRMIVDVIPYPQVQMELHRVIASSQE